MKQISSKINTRLGSSVGLLAAGLLLCGLGSAPGGAATKPINFGVVSDLHMLNVARLGASGPDFEAYLDQDPKLLRESEAILDSALRGLVEAKVKFVIVPGDLTKDGEMIDHIAVLKRFAWLERQGIQVFVAPGNHDINNPDAVAYLGASTRKVARVNPQAFRALYQRYGYRQAIASDPNSLSYVAQPAPGLRLLGIDSCKYEESKSQPHPVTSGRIKPETMNWIVEQLQAAKASGNQVIAFMHHGVNLHFMGEDQIFPEFLVDDYAGVSSQLADAGLKVIFTGHYHSQDAAYPLNAEGVPVPTLCDVETSSLVMYPCAYRVVTLAGSALQIQSRRVTEIDYDTGGVPFQQYAENFLRTRMLGEVTARLVALFQLPEQQAAQIAPIVADALVANYAGDETMTQATLGMIQYFIGQPEPMRTLGMVLWGIWTDLPPGDNELTVSLGN